MKLFNGTDETDPINICLGVLAFIIMLVHTWGVIIICWCTLGGLLLYAGAHLGGYYYMLVHTWGVIIICQCTLGGLLQARNAMLQLLQ